MAVMAVSERRSANPREKNMISESKTKKKVYLIAQELKLARVLAGNNKTSRDRALKTLKKWFAHRSKTLPFTDKDFQRIWKGLYFSMWMSDKPLIQEECAENISSLIHFQTIDESLLFFKAGLTILINEWFGIDQLRLDKFLMLVRRLLRHMLMALKTHGLGKKNIDKFGEVILYTILNTGIHPPTGLFMHFTEIYLEEIAKVTKGNIPSERIIDFIRPFIKKLVVTTDGREMSHVRKFIFNYLMKQSDLGLEYQVKYDAWKREGFPGSIDSMQKVKSDGDAQKLSNNTEDDTGEKPLDPRAGRVDVELPQLKFKAKDVVSALTEFKFDKDSNSKSRKTLNELINQFTKMCKGVYPLGVKRVLDLQKDSYDTSVRKAANRLIKFEQKLMGKDKKRKRSGKKDEEKTEVAQKRRKLDQEVDKGESSVTEKELKEFIQKSEGVKEAKKEKKKRVDKEQGVGDKTGDEKTVKLSKRKRKIDLDEDKKEIKKKRNMKEAALEVIINNIECVFERNSGTWVVYNIRKRNVDVPSTKTEVSDFVISKQANSHKSKATEQCIPNENKTSPPEGPPGELSSPKSGLSCVRLFESPPESKELFPKSAWDEALQEGEYEICIPSKKHIARLKRKAKKTDQNVHELINTSLKQLKGKSRLSLDSRLVKNPFSTPGSTKKVKINTKLNMSQEIHEHVQQILSSPGIPYDANKKPLKPLLKTSACSTPVNPFYNKQLSNW
ncbi:hypothetical protein NQ315_002411 [Exocentrus adspersus]|uniref:Ribosomal RNA processing protein 1 homolog n=1 Tax=Exocentrus adspersus TaxID=1586481 RepID=A0AAV8VST1_9CUCU|nr:hypothetical protein NQ315_002411 [Exocentrus adspersus]